MAEKLRESEFIDFNTGTVKIAPMELQRTFSQPLQLADKIRLFHCRLEVWNLGVAVQLLKQIESHTPPSIWSHSAFGLLAVGFTYFETIGKTINPASKKKDTASQDFNFGFCDVYPEYQPSSSPVKEFRNRVRNGIYHLTFTKKSVLMHNNLNFSNKDFDVIQQNGDAIYTVNPHSMIRTIVGHFPKFIDRLINPDTQYDGLRKKFVTFFDEYYDV
jgi:hypothetical protein